MIYFIFFNLLVLIFFNRIKIFYNIYDRPNLIRKIHKKKMPVLGGFILFLNLFLVFFFIAIEPLTGKKIIKPVINIKKLLENLNLNKYINKNIKKNNKKNKFKNIN